MLSIEAQILNNYLRNRVEYRLILRGYSAPLRGIITVLLFNTLIPKDSFIAEKLKTIFIVPFLSPTHKITYITGYLLTADDECLGSVTLR